MSKLEAVVDSVAMVSRSVVVEAPHGPVSGLLVAPDVSTARSAVLVVADRAGLDESLVAVCEALARAGHAVLAMDLVVSQLEPSAGLSALSIAAIDRCTAAVTSGLDLLKSEARTTPSRLGVVGYGAGGLVALAAGYRCQVGAAISFYGEGPMRLREHLSHIIHAPKRHAAALLCLVGGNDPDVRPPDLGAIRDRLGAFGMRSTFIVYPRTQAGFCDPQSVAYRPAEAHDAWSKVLRALETAPRLRHRFSVATRPSNNVADPLDTEPRRTTE
jgi:carboxymethylenebutenolidase